MLYSYQKEYFAGCQYDNICIGCIGAINLSDINLVSCTVCGKLIDKLLLILLIQ